MHYELTCAGLFIQAQVPLPVIYKEIRMETAYRLDFLVENCVVVEIKSVEALMDVHSAQILTYIKLAKATHGLLMNFNVLRLTSGIKRFIAKD